MTADFFAKKAAERSAQCTDFENQQRQENGRKPNTSHAFTEGEAELFLGDSETLGDESEYQPTRFGTAFGTGFA